MAVKFDAYYVRRLGEKSLTIKDLQGITNLTPEVRLTWGGEYVNFRYTTPMLPDEDVEYVLEGFRDCGEDTDIPVGLYPSDGSHSLLGYRISKNSIELKIYSPKEFCQLSETATELIAIVHDVEDTPTPTQNLFHTITTSKYTDYSQTVTDLKQRGLLSTCMSTNMIRTDERRFTLKSLAGKIIPSLQEHIGITYEVDSLGTSFYDILTKGVEKLWSIHLKVLAEPKHEEHC